LPSPFYMRAETFRKRFCRPPPGPARQQNISCLSSIGVFLFYSVLPVPRPHQPRPQPGISTCAAAAGHVTNPPPVHGSRMHETKTARHDGERARAPLKSSSSHGPQLRPPATAFTSHTEASETSGGGVILAAASVACAYRELCRRISFRPLAASAAAGRCPLAWWWWWWWLL